MFSVVWMGCAAYPSRRPVEEAPRRFHVSVQGRFQTELISPGVVQPGVVAEAPILLPPLAEDLDLIISLAWAREYQDGSLGQLLRFERATSLSRGPPGDHKRDPHPMEGRSLELRQFPDGELLQLDLLEHVAGGDRNGEVWALVLAALSPRPPDIPRTGEHRSRTARWPLFLDRDRGVWETLEADWSLLPVERIGAERCWRLHYQGNWRSLGGDDESTTPYRVEARGEAEGDVWIARGDHGLMRHELRWSRRVDLAPVGVETDKEEGRGRIRQTQSFTAQVERSP